MTNSFEFSAEYTHGKIRYFKALETQDVYALALSLGDGTPVRRVEVYNPHGGPMKTGAWNYVRTPEEDAEYQADADQERRHEEALRMQGVEF